MKMHARIVQGDDVELIIDLKRKDGTPLNAAGASAIVFKAISQCTGAEAIVKTLGAGVALASPATQVTVSLTDDDTSGDNLPAGMYDFEIQITASTGDILTVRDFNDQPGTLEVLADLDR